MKKYALTQNKLTLPDGEVIYRIKALIDIPSIKVKKGDLGGFVENENNLTQEGNCWVAEEARVYESARVFGNAHIYGSAQVHGNACISGDAYVYHYTSVYGNAQVYEYARVCGNAQVYGGAQISGNAFVYGNALVHGNALVSGSAYVYDNARVKQDASVCGSAQVGGDACVYGDAILQFSEHVYFIAYTDLSKDKKASIAAQTGIRVSDSGVFYAYKHVQANLASLKDANFIYKLNKRIEVKNPDLTNASCASGIHVSTADYWNFNSGIKIIICKCHIDDVITVQEGKIRMKAVTPIDVVSEYVY